MRVIDDFDKGYVFGIIGNSRIALFYQGAT